MNIRASPKRGLNRHKEEEHVLKLKKSLFVPKPKSVSHPDHLADTSSVKEVGEDDGDMVRAY